jgi:hypothetical protein
VARCCNGRLAIGYVAGDDGLAAEITRLHLGQHRTGDERCRKHSDSNAYAQIGVRLEATDLRMNADEFTSRFLTPHASGLKP